MLFRRVGAMAGLTVRTDFEAYARLMPCHTVEGTLAFAELPGPRRLSSSSELEKYSLYLPLSSKPPSTHIPSLVKRLISSIPSKVGRLSCSKEKFVIL